MTNHEYTDENLMFPTGEYDDATIKKIAMAAHGMAVVTIERGRAKGSWIRSDHRRAKHNRRITVHTEFAFHGPAAGHELLRTAADPTGTRVHGTFGNCAGGTTPWGTVLSGEENFNGYFDASGAVDAANATSFKRYGLATAAATNRGWSTVDERFDLAKHPHEAYRFGWVVEVDPYEPGSTPVKQTMLGRFKHEGANVTISESGHAVAYMGDDERGDYLYKFVSADRFRKGDSRSRPRPQQDAPDQGHPLRREVRRRRHGRRRVRRRRDVGRPDLRHDVLRPRHDASRRCSSTRASPPTPSARRRWTAPRTSSPTRSTARSTPP